jgi:hypothetical protein
VSSSPLYAGLCFRSWTFDAEAQIAITVPTEQVGFTIVNGAGLFL